MGKVAVSELPASSRLHAMMESADFLDCYWVKSGLSVREAAERALDSPDWVALLMKLRNILVSPWGLSDGASEDIDNIGGFPIDTESADEIILGFDDKHLNFRISVFKDESRVYFATWVRPHNIGGRLYLGLVMPFHVLIVRNALHRVASMGDIAG